METSRRPVETSRRPVCALSSDPARFGFHVERCPVATRLPDAWSVVNPVFYDVGYFLLQQVALIFWFLNGGIKCTLFTIFCMDLCI